MIALRTWQTGGFAALAAISMALWLLLEPSEAWQVWILAPAVAFLGLPHGAFDLPLAERLWALRGVRGLLVFSAAYLGLAALVLIAWWAVPGIALALFLAYSALHFSSDWDGDPMVWRLGGGLSSVGAPAWTHPEAVTQVFSGLSTPEAAAVITPALAVGGMVGAATLAVALLRHPARGPAVEVTVIWLAAIALPPLIYFVVYFCGLHSPRHLIAALSDVAPDRRALGQALTVTLVTLAGATGAVVWLTTRATLDAALLQAVFIGLAALTVPHMLLVERWSRGRAT